MLRITYQDIMALGPCFDPATGLDNDGGYYCKPVCTPDWEGTLVDILQAEGVSYEDKLWVVCREGWVPDATLWEFARWCALQVIHLWDAPAVVREYLETGAEEKRTAAWAAARTAAWAAARDAAWDAAWAAARAAARDAARAAARTAAWDAAMTAAWAAARTAARAAARDAAWAAARAAAWGAQLNKLIELLENLDK